MGNQAVVQTVSNVLQPSHCVCRGGRGGRGNDKKDLEDDIFKIVKLVAQKKMEPVIVFSFNRQ
jgi:hypothetical protein